MKIAFLQLCIILGLYSCNNSSESKPESTDTIFISQTDSVEIIKVPMDSVDNYDPLLNQIICTEKLPIPPITIQRKLYFERDNGDLDSSISYITYTAEQALSQKLFTCQQFIWEKDTLSVSFLDGDEIVKRRVMETAKKWEQYCSIVFKFGEFPIPDISISFRYGVNESCIGNTSKFSTPSMKFTGLRQNSTQELYDRYVLHEFGHALGLFHEHQHKNANIPWNVSFLNEYYGRYPNRWTPEDVRINILEKINYANCFGSEFDKKSIMMYEILPAMVTNQAFVVKANQSLSETDKISISSIYPKQ